MLQSRSALAIATALIALSGCSSSKGETSRGELISDVADAKRGVIQIIAQGSFVDFESGQQKSKLGSGSGFIIDPSGIAVTNQHVVDGAGSIDVFVGGGTEAINAKILGVSECNDLAVIDLAGDGYDYFEWYEGDLEPGLEVFAAGFPLGDPEYTLTDGIIAKARANGDYVWASIDYAVEHSANIQPGNSGGALLTKDAKVAAVNFAGGGLTNTEQFFAIPSDIASEVTQVLKQGADQDSIGINGYAIWNDQANVGGLWVSGVRAGSAAANAGVQGGDIVIKLQGRDVVSQYDNATKKGYCDVLRTNGSDKPMSITVYRESTKETLSGEVNNSQKALTVESKPSTTPDEENTTSSSSSNSVTVYETKSDELDLVEMQVPKGWYFDSFSESGISTTAIIPEEYSNYGFIVIAMKKIDENEILKRLSIFESDCKGENKVATALVEWSEGKTGSGQYYDCNDENATAWITGWTDNFWNTTIIFVAVYEGTSKINVDMVNLFYNNLLNK